MVTADALDGRRALAAVPHPDALGVGVGRGDRPGPGEERGISHRGLRRGQATGPSPVDRRRKGVVTNAAGFPTAAVTAPENGHDATPLVRAVDAAPPARGPRGRPYERRDDRDFDSKVNRDAFRCRAVSP